MCRVASAPNPVDTPYTGVSDAACRSTWPRAARSRSSDSWEISTGAPCLATSTSSASVSGLSACSTTSMAPSHRTGPVGVLIPFLLLPEPAHVLPLPHDERDDDEQRNQDGGCLGRPATVGEHHGGQRHAVDTRAVTMSR